MKNTNNSQDKEIWKDIEGFEGIYEVSSHGRVRNKKNGRILGGGFNKNGYRIIGIKGKKYLIHRLVALAFIPNPYKLPEVNHIDERKDNNYVNNLEWCSRSYNVVYSSHKRSCKIKQLDKNGKLLKVWNSVSQIVKELGYDISAIVKVLKGKRRSAYSFKWEYADASQQHKHNRPVAALTKDGELVAEYKSAAEASRCLKIKYSCIYPCLNGKIKSIHGLKFIYID